MSKSDHPKAPEDLAVPQESEEAFEVVEPLSDEELEEVAGGWEGTGGGDDGGG